MSALDPLESTKTHPGKRLCVYGPRMYYQLSDPRLLAHSTPSKTTTHEQVTPEACFAPLRLTRSAESKIYNRRENTTVYAVKCG